jgi:hypothetical protein
MVLASGVVHSVVRNESLLSRSFDVVMVKQLKTLFGKCKIIKTPSKESALLQILHY